MENQIPVREVKIYQADDGRKIEKYEIIATIIEETDQKETYQDEKILFVGVASAMSESGIHELNFPISASSISEAFENFHSSLEEFIKEQETHIIQANSTDMGNLIL